MPASRHPRSHGRAYADAPYSRKKILMLCISFFFLLMSASVQGGAQVAVTSLNTLDAVPEQPVYNNQWRDVTLPKMLRESPRQFQRIFRLTLNMLNP